MVINLTAHEKGVCYAREGNDAGVVPTVSSDNGSDVRVPGPTVRQGLLAPVPGKTEARVASMRPPYVCFTEVGRVPGAAPGEASQGGGQVKGAGARVFHEDSSQAVWRHASCC